MAVLSYIEQTKVEKCPIEFQCDICKSVFKIKSKYAIEYRADVKYQLAVVKYSEPAGYNDKMCELHCCSTSCLVEAIKKIPFGANITIPVDGFYKKQA